MNHRTTHPLATAYLEELERLLAGIDPAERAEVMAGVREHLDGSLPSHGPVTDGEVREVLAELGPPQAVADEAYAGRPAYAASSPTAAPRVPAMSRPWVPVVVAILTAVGILLAILVAGTMAGVTTSTSVDSSGLVVETSELSGSPVWTSFAAILVTLPVWVAISLLVGSSPLWVGREKLVVVLLVPAGALLTGLLPLLGWWLVGVNGVYAGAWVSLALVVGGGGWLMARITQRAAARAALRGPLVAS